VHSECGWVMGGGEAASEVEGGALGNCSLGKNAGWPAVIWTPCLALPRSARHFNFHRTLYSCVSFTPSPRSTGAQVIQLACLYVIAALSSVSSSRLIDAFLAWAMDTTVDIPRIAAPRRNLHHTHSLSAHSQYRLFRLGHSVSCCFQFAPNVSTAVG
jgi:hypothetical protein